MRVRTLTDVGRRVRQRRKALHRDRAELTRRVGVSHQCIIGIEQGKARADFSSVMRTLDALGIVPWAEGVGESSAGTRPDDAPPFSAVRTADVPAAHRGAGAVD